MSPLKLTPYAERLLAQRTSLPVLKAPTAPAPRIERQAVLYDPARRALHLRHARLFIKNVRKNLVGYAKAHDLSPSLMFQAVRFARANPKAKIWPRKPIGNRRQISDVQLAAIRHAYNYPAPGETLPQIAERIGITRSCLNHYFHTWTKGAAK